MTREPRLALFAEASAATGLGHLIRTSTIGAAAQGRGWDVTLVLRRDALDFAVDLGHDAGFTVEIRDWEPWPTMGSVDAVVLDSYRVSPAAVAALQATNRTTLVLWDMAPTPHTLAFTLNQNFGADETYAVPDGATWLLGSRYALIRQAFQRLRPDEVSIAALREVVVMAGGTDPTGVAPVLARACLEAFATAEVTVIDPAAAQLARDGRLTRMPPLRSPEEVMSRADLLVTAAGSTMWEGCTLRLPMAVLPVAANQLPATRELARRGVVVDLSADAPLASPDPAALRAALAPLAHPGTRDALARAAGDLVDGWGSERVVEAIARYAGVSR